jgi:hypothetical protein
VGLTAAAIVMIWVAAQAVSSDPVSDPVRERDVSVVAEALGGGEDARQYAEEVVPRRETPLAFELPPEVSW